ATEWREQTKTKGTALLAPMALKRLLNEAADELRQQIHELILADLREASDSPVPPEYEQLVEKYLKLLSTEAQQF
ncbi:MAG: hypothetical protein ACK5Q5_13235, partial [Planctomycetaceae bacterium]